MCQWTLSPDFDSGQHRKVHFIMGGFATAQIAMLPHRRHSLRAGEWGQGDTEKRNIALD